MQLCISVCEGSDVQRFLRRQPRVCGSGGCPDHGEYERRQQSGTTPAHQSLHLRRPHLLRRVGGGVVQTLVCQLGKSVFKSF